MIDLNLGGAFKMLARMAIILDTPYPVWQHLTGTSKLSVLDCKSHCVAAAVLSSIISMNT
jgi:hypothetical protein